MWHVLLNVLHCLRLSTPSAPQGPLRVAHLTFLDMGAPLLDKINAAEQARMCELYVLLEPAPPLLSATPAPAPPRIDAADIFQIVRM